MVWFVVQISGFTGVGTNCNQAFTTLGNDYELGLPPYLTGTFPVPTILYRAFACDGNWDPGSGTGEFLATFESGCDLNTTFDLYISRRP